jgi:hypothetical protein
MSVDNNHRGRKVLIDDPYMVLRLDATEHCGKEFIFL